ncbi:unnamed protein product, partial [Vitis vinifera]|uniref:Uncharacterized protein n=1 Tax=Vitis vinifera TaxID=29760 RepID=D7SZ11_VITVI
MQAMYPIIRVSKHHRSSKIVRGVVEIPIGFLPKFQTCDGERDPVHKHLMHFRRVMTFCSKK